MKNVLLITLIMILIAGCDLNICDNLIISELGSPNNAYIATAFIRGCGATTPTLTIVSLRKKNTKLDLENYNSWVFSIASNKGAKIKWLNNNALKISYVWEGEQPTRKKEKWDTIKVIY